MSDGKIRRGSLFWPLFFIAVGVVFLLRLAHPQLPLGRWFAQYWPLILIALGLVRIIEYLLRRGAPGPVISGGEIVAIVFLVIFGLAASHYYRGDWMHRGWKIDLSDLDIYRDTFEFSDQVTQPLPPGSSVNISVPEGNLTVRAGDAAEVRIVAQKRVAADREEDAKKIAGEVQVRVVKTASGVEIRPEFDTSGPGRVKRVDLEVTLPVKADLQLSGNRGDVHVNGIQGDIRVTSRLGDVELQAIKGKAEVDLTRGSIRVAKLEGNFRLTGRGDEIDLADITGEANIQGEFLAISRSRTFPG